MDAKELRIGNIVLKKIHKVWVSFKIQYHDIAILYESDLINKVPSFNYKPIPLTEEWLLKMGFKKKKEWLFDLVINRIKLRIHIIQKEGNLRILGTGEFINCQHVHQLQNLYRCLTGTELEIK